MTTAEVALAPGGRPQFVGRQRELAWLRGLLAEAGRGEARVALIGGEPGVGKTSLVREFLAEADAAGWQTVWGHCSEDSVTPHQPFAAGLVPQLRRAGLIPADGELAVLRGEDPALVAAELADKTVALAGRRQLVFVIDDFQYGEPATLQLILEYVRNVAETARKQPLAFMLVVTHHVALAGDAFGRLLDRIRTEPITHSEELRGLDDLEVHELVRQASSESCDPLLLGRLVEATHGNPFFVLEVVHNLERRHLLVHEAGKLTTKEQLVDLQLPANAPASVADRLKGADKDVLRVLQTAALLGDEFTVEDLASLHPDIDLDVALDNGVAAGLLVHTGAGLGFSHGMVRTAVTESIGPMRRRKAHAELARALIARHGDDPAHSLEIASHVAAAGAWPDEIEAGHIFERAGDFALDSFLWGTAQRYFEAALALPKFLVGLDGRQTAWLYARAARANNNNGDRDRSRELHRRSMELYRDVGDLTGWGLQLLGWWRAFANAGQLIPEDGSYEEFADAAGDEVFDVRARLLVHKAENLWTARHPGDYQAGLDAVELAHRSSDPETRAQAATVMGNIYNRHLEPERAIEQFEDATRETEVIPNPRLKGWGRARIPLSLILAGRLSEARAACVEERDLPGAGQDLANGPLNLGAFHATSILAGEFETAKALRTEGMLLQSRTYYPAASFIFAPASAWDRLQRGEYDEAEDAIDLWARSGGRGVSRSLRLLLILRRGDQAEVRRQLAEMPLQLASAGVDFSNIGAIAVATELASELSLADIAENAWELLDPVVRRGVVFSVSPPILLPRAAAMAARTCGRLDAALDLLELADAAAAKAHAAPEVGLIELERARLLTARRAPIAEIETSVAAAAAVFRQFQMVSAAEQLLTVAERAKVSAKLAGSFGFLDELAATEAEVLERFAQDGNPARIADSLLLSGRTVEAHLDRLRKRLGITSPAAARAFLEAVRRADAQRAGVARRPELAELTPRELEVLQLIARGLTNQGIADELIISLHTAIRHVANILGKTGAANRTEAARLAG